MVYVMNKKNPTKYILYYILYFKLAIVHLDESFAQYWHCVISLNDVITWNLLKLACMFFQKIIIGISCCFNPLSINYVCLNLYINI